MIGGLALATHQVVRAMRDVDFLADANDADRFHEILIGLGYRCAIRSVDAANYVRGDEGLDLLYAHRPIARKLLNGAASRQTVFGSLRVVSAEGLIGFKLQALANNPSRIREFEDMRGFLAARRGNLDMQEVGEYFALFDRTDGSMSSLPKLIMTRTHSNDEPIAGRNAPGVVVAGKQDLSDWIELMEVVEALCPEWPPQARRVEGSFKL